MISTCTLAMTLTVTEKSSFPYVNAAANKGLAVDAFNVSKTLTPTSTPAVTLMAAGSLVMVAGHATLDLRVLADMNGAVDLNGLKVQAMLLTNPTTSANNVVITPGTTNGYTFGSTLTLSPGASCLLYAPEGLPDVAAGVKTIDINGTGTQSLNYEIVAG